MPQRTNAGEPPPRMTWGKALPVLVISAVFDAVRFMFTWFIFFGPALAGLYCTVKGSSTAIGDMVGTTVVGAACGIGAVATGVVGAGAIETFGIIMAMATGFAGWLAILIILLVFNTRIFKENTLWFGGSLLISEIPFINSLPTLTFTMWKMYHTQITIETANRKKWEKERAQEERQKRERQTVQRSQQMWQAQLAQQQEQQKAANDEQYNNEEISEEEREAA